MSSPADFAACSIFRRSVALFRPALEGPVLAGFAPTLSRGAWLVSNGQSWAAMCEQMSVPRFAWLLVWLAANPAPADPAPHPCPGTPAALSTSRVTTVDAATTPRVGRKHFPATLPLADKEVVLTFDDGPRRGTTSAVLNALK